MVRKKIVYIERKYLVLIFIVVLFFVGIYYFVFELPSIKKTEIMNCSCPIDFGKPKCVGGKQYVPFHNPTSNELSSIKLTAKKFNGYDIYNVNQPLKENESEVLELYKCYTTDEMKIDWCCGNTCCQAPITAYSEEWTVAPG
jgi:hypothetical protein